MAILPQKRPSVALRHAQGRGHALPSFIFLPFHTDQAGGGGPMAQEGGNVGNTGPVMLAPVEQPRLAPGHRRTPGEGNLRDKPCRDRRYSLEHRYIDTSPCASVSSSIRWRVRGVEPLTGGLRNSCSTTELRRLGINLSYGFGGFGGPAGDPLIQMRMKLFCRGNGKYITQGPQPTPSAFWRILDYQLAIFVARTEATALVWPSHGMDNAL